ncbi:hypothetical protein T03_16261 [Trichinella britovi]|uniref:Uncharacterized protein n=1 Tax=Trichinella britovi TaxID=45882 RepID=A0A0V1D069_TRIBR|nr:hypothetical protein T03_16261 [Trichinella britovi]
MTAQRNPPIDTRSSPRHDSANGPVGVRNESARKRGSLHYHQPLLSMMMKSTHQRSSLFRRRRRSRLTLSQCRNLEKTHLLQKAQAWLVWNYEIGTLVLCLLDHELQRSFIRKELLLSHQSAPEWKHVHKEKNAHTSINWNYQKKFLIGILIGINYSYGFVLGGVIKKEESTVASEFHSRLDHVRKQIPVSHESNPKVRRKYVKAEDSYE